MSDARRDAGLQLVREVFGEEFMHAVDRAGSNAFGGEAAEFALRNAYADFWTRPGLTRRERSMVTMALIIGLRTPAQFKNHVHGALNNGCTINEIEEVIYQAIPYLGFPTMAVALHAAGEVLQERGLIGELAKAGAR